MCKKLLYLCVCCLLTLGVFSCGSSRKIVSQVSLEEKDPLTPQERRKYDYYFLEAVRMKQKGCYDDAYQLYQHCLDIYPASAAVLFELAQFYMFLGQQDKGEEALLKAIRSDEDNFWYKQTLASFYMQKMEMQKAIAVYEGMSKRFPARLEPLMSLVELYNRTKSYQQVVNTLNRLEELDGKSEQISMEKLRMYLLLDDKNQAFTEIENLSKEYPYDMRYQNMLGDIYLDNDRVEEAYQTYQHILKEEPDYAPTLISLATYYQKTGQDSLYRVQLDTILLNEEVQTEAKMEIMRQLIMQNEQAHADSTQIVNLFDSILSRPQQNADLAMLGAQYFITKQMEGKAVPVLHQVLSLDPENKPARLQLLSYAIRDNDMDKVIKITRPALQYNPEALEFYYYLGLAYYQKKETDKALDVFARGIKQVNEKSDKAVVSDFYAILGDLYHTKKMQEEAYAAYDSALVYNADNIGVMNNYAYYLSVERKNLDKAEELSYRTIKAEPNNTTYLDTYAWILFEKERYTEARIYIDQALRNGGEKSWVILEHCGDIYFLSGEKDKAVEYWKKAEKVASGEHKEEETLPTAEEMALLKKKITLKKYIAK